MKKTLILMAAAASVVLTGCTESDISNDTSLAKESAPSAIEFSAKTRNAGATRTGTVGTITTASLKTGDHKNDGFGVMGYQMTADWANNQTSTEPNFMFNEQVKWDTRGFWIYDPVKYWPNGNDKANTANKPSNTATSTNTDRLSFFAYAPWVDVSESSYVAGKIVSKETKKFGDDAVGRDFFYTSASEASDLGNGIAAITANNLKAAPEVYYYMPTATTAAAVDLLWGLRGSETYKETDATDNTVTSLGDSYNVNLTKQDVPETVDFLFKHALAKIGGNTSSKTAITGNQQSGLDVVLDVDGNGYGNVGRDNQSNYLGTTFNSTKTLVTISSVSVEDGASAADNSPKHAEAGTESNLKNSGWFNLATGSWSNVGIIDKTGTTAAKGATYDVEADATTTPIELNPDIKEGTVKNSTGVDWQYANSENQGYTGGAKGVTTTPQPVYADTKASSGAANDVPALLMIPSGDSQTLYITVTYIVRTADPQLSGGFTTVTQTVTNKVDLSGLNVNKYYKLVMHLGLTSVKFSAVVTDWAATDDATYDEGGTHDGEEPSTEVVWLPSNVINATTTTTSAAGTSSNVNTAAKTTTYTITLSGLAAGEKILATESADNITAVKIKKSDNSEVSIMSEHALVAEDFTTGKVNIVVTLIPNTKVSAISNLLTITQTASNNTELSKTSVNIVQSPFDIVLAETTAGKVVSVKDGDDQNIDITNAAAYTVTVLDSEGVTVNPSNYTKAAEGTITMNTAGTYTVIVEYDEDNNSTTDMTKTIKIKQ